MFERVMDIERQLRVRSTFYFLNEKFPFRPWKLSSWRLALGYYDLFEERLQAMIRELDRGGWEIGLHGSYLSYRDITMLRMEKSDLERIVGHPVDGVRQHYLNLDRHTWAKQAEVGFLYDASFGFTNDIGFKDSRYQPFQPLQDTRFYVMPLAIMDSCLIKKPKPLDFARNLIDLAEYKGACLVLNWHQERFNAKEFPGWGDLYIRLIEECQARNARFMTIGQYIEEIKKS